MSYDINNYAFLGIPVRDVAEAMPAGAEINMDTNGVYVLVDEKFVQLAQSVEPFANDWDCSSVEIMVNDGYLYAQCITETGPMAFFSRLIFTAAGITSPIFYKEELGLLMSVLFQIKFLPVGLAPFTARGKPCELGLVYVEDCVLVPLLKALAETKQLTLLDPAENWNDPPIKLSCVKTALQNLLTVDSEKTSQDGAIPYSIEEWMRIFIRGYLELRDCSSNVSVGSTAHGTVHDLGGMEDGVPYVVYDGMCSYDENGWDDPREEDPDTVQQIRDCLLGEGTSQDWEKLTPQFGG